VTATVQLVGPGLVALVALAVLIWVFSGFVAIDALRRRRTDYAGVLEGRWFYAAPQMVFFAVFIAWQVPWVPANAPWIGNLLLAIPVVLAQQMGYLLRVVYPTSKRLEKRLDAECALLREEVEAPADGPAPHRSSEAEGFFDPDDPDA
jgi:hypothetical protein